MLDFLRFYNRPQHYRCEIKVNVKNTGSDHARTTLIVPVPMTTDYQTTTPAFQERTKTFELNLDPGVSKTISIPFEAKVLPRRYVGTIAAEMKVANELVINYLTYGNPIDGLYTAQEAREKKVVDCGGFDALLQDELKNKGIESVVIAGFWSDGGMHAWLEIHPGIPADPSMEYLRRRSRSRKSGKLGFVGSDRIAFSTWQPGEQFLQKPFLSGSTAQLKYVHHFYCTCA